MNRYQAYPKYKDSGVAWLGEVPAHWGIKKLKFNLQLITQKQLIENQTVIALENIESGSGKFIPTESAYQGEDVAFESGDVLFGKLRPYLAKVFLTNSQGVAFGDLLTFRAKNKFSSHFGFYSMLSNSFISIVDSSTYGTKMPRASAEFIAEMPLTTPPFAEQTAIANFLDTQTAKIDTLIAKQQRMIALLGEKRQAVISHAVTKGLNPDAPMKDSGVEWLGEVPAHWETWKMAHAFPNIGSGTTPKSDNALFYDDEFGTPWLNTGDLNDAELYSCAKKVSDFALQECSSLKTYPPNSIVIAMYGATIGKLAILKFATTVNQACCVFSESNKITNRFLFYWLLGLRQQIISLATGGGQPNISQDILRGLSIAVPCNEEQTAIANFLDTQTAKIDNLISKAKSAITLMQERRSALISAAVTGKIDVRELA